MSLEFYPIAFGAHWGTRMGNQANGRWTSGFRDALERSIERTREIMNLHEFLEVRVAQGLGQGGRITGGCRKAEGHFQKDSVGACCRVGARE